MLLPVLIDKDFRLPFGDNDADIQIDNLPGLMAATPVLSRRQEASVYSDGLDDIGVADLLQGFADMAMLPAWFSSTSGFPLFFIERSRKNKSNKSMFPDAIHSITYKFFCFKNFLFSKRNSSCFHESSYFCF